MLSAVTGLVVPSLLGVAPLRVATVADERRTSAFAGAAAALAIGTGWRRGATGHVTYRAQVTAVCAISAMAVVMAGVRRRREERLARMTAIAQASQLALLPSLPPEMTGISLAAVAAWPGLVPEDLSPRENCGRWQSVKGARNGL